MPRQREGCTVTRNGKLYARVTYVDSIGKRHDLLRRAENKTHAKELRRQLINQIADRGELAIAGDKLTFNQLANIYSDHKVKPAEYHHERKIAGLRSYFPIVGYIQTLTEHFGKKLIKNITNSDVENFKQVRLKTPTKQGKNRAIASVNRELELLRAIMRFAVRQGWLVHSPFDTGSTLISKADEVHRERVLTTEEEKRLLSVCIGKREHLYKLLIAALDTGMRRGELLKLKWQDIDFDNRLIYIRATTTKTMRERTVGLTQRLFKVLQQAYEQSTKDVNNIVFGIKDNFKIAFASACRDARIKDFRFHDCRHTAITRMIQSGMPAHLVMKVSGHTQHVTFARYVNVDEQAARQGATALDEFLEKQISLVEANKERIN